MTNRRPPTRLLLVEDNPGDARLLREMLKEPGWDRMVMTHVESMTEAEAWLSQKSTDIILLDFGLHDTLGLDGVRRARQAAPNVPIVILTGRDEEALADHALHEGAEDYLIKGQIEPRNLLRSLRYAIERKVMEEALFAEKERAEVTLNSIGDAVISCDPAGVITFLNIVAEQMTGWPREEALGRQLPDVFVGVDAERRSASPDLLTTVFDHDRSPHRLSNLVLVGRDKPEVPVEVSVSPMYDRDGGATGSVIIFRDVSAAHAVALEMTHSYEHDFLTGLPNRVLLNDRITQAIALAPRHGKQVAVLFLDLDGFKHINDSLGHPVGDELLKSIAARLEDCVRSSDTVSRQGGDEFVVLLSEAEQGDEAGVVAQRMLTAVAETHTIDLRELHVTTSIGVSVYPDDGKDAETLIKNADTAMYQAKENGRQSFQFFEPAMNVRAVERQLIEEQLRRALQADEFVLHYQPQVNLETGEITGAEALIRWNHPTRGLVSPARFIPIAEDSGLIRAIGHWVLREATRQSREWIDDGLPPITMAVNVSASELRDEIYVERLVATIDQAGLEPDSMILELTETVLMKNAPATATALNSVKRAGVHIALDDFGTGYSSLSYLRDFPIDSLKIDQSFVSEVASADEKTGIVTAVISMAQSLGLSVVAEGVETSAQVGFLKAQSCDAAQGFYFSRPVTPEIFGNLVAAGQRFEPD